MAMYISSVIWRNRSGIKMEEDILEYFTRYCQMLWAKYVISIHATNKYE